MRKLKYHEQKLLRKVNMDEWEETNSAREHAVTEKYHIAEREEYHRYNLIVGKIRRLALALAKLSDSEELKKSISAKLAGKLYALGIIESKTLLESAKVTVSKVCSRRLSAVMAKAKMCPDIKTASRFVEHGHVILGARPVTTPGILVSRAMEGFVAWRPGSKIGRKVESFNGEEDDYKEYL
jgi:U3 small nucleolar ribonucleoprotein protein IMP3